MRRVHPLVFGLTLTIIAITFTAGAEGPQLRFTNFRKEKSAWRDDALNAIKDARSKQRPIVLHFHASWCGPCREMERDVLDTREVQQVLQRDFVAIRVDTDEYTDLSDRYSISALPSDVFLAPDGKVIARTEGVQAKSSYIARLKGIATRYPKKAEVVVEKKTTIPNVLKQPAETGSENEKDTGTATVTAKSSKPILGLDGFSPVHLMKTRQWKRGDLEFEYTYKGITYRMADAAELDVFKKEPSKYAPRVLGCDPVILYEDDKAVTGSTQFGAFFDNELFLFVSAESRTKFKAKPLRYTRTRHAFKATDIEVRRFQ